MKFTNIQVIRFAAAASVLIFHVGRYSQSLLHLQVPAIAFMAEPIFGMGVIAFFAVSGFVLAHSIQTTSVPRFLGLRAARIYPPYWTAYAAVVGVQLLIGGSQPILGVWRLAKANILRALLLIPPGGSDRAYYALSVEWTLVYEVFFYAVLGLFALTGRRRGLPACTAIWLGLVMVRMAIHPTGDGRMFPSWGSIVFSPMIPPFLLGVLAYYMRQWAERIRLWSPLIGASCVALAYAAGYTMGKADVHTLLGGFGFSLLVLWAASGPQLRADHPLVRFGDYSYGVYLVHVPVLLFLSDKGIGAGRLPYSLAGVVAAGLTTLLIGLGYGRLETTCHSRLRRWLLPTKRRVPETVIVTARAA